MTGLAFETPDLIADAKIGILAASVLAGALGTIVLLTLRRHPATSPAPVDDPGPSDLSARAP